MYCKNFPHIKCLSHSILIVEWHSITWYILWFLTLLVEYLSCLCFGDYLIILSSGHREGNGTPLQYSCLESPMDRGAWWAAVHGATRSQTRLSKFTFTFHFHALGEGNGKPLQCSCLENPRDGGAWWAAIYGVAQSLTQLKQLSSSSSSMNIIRTAGV